MSMPLVLGIFVVGLFVVITIHELGHFVVSKMRHIKVEEFGLGFPPRLWGIRRGETLYSINAVPVGAFVKSVAEDDPTVPGSLASKGPWSRLGVYAAGPLANVFLAFIVLAAFFALPTRVLVADGLMVYSVVDGSPADRAALTQGDIILEVNGEPVNTSQEMRELVSEAVAQGDAASLLVRSDGRRRALSMTPEYDARLERPLIGVTLAHNVVQDVAHGSLADRVGVEVGDSIVSLNGHLVYAPGQLADLLESFEGTDQIDLVLRRGDEVVTRSLTAPVQSERDFLGMRIKWAPDVHVDKQFPSTLTALAKSGDFIVHMPHMIVAAFPLIKEDPGKALVGPIGAGQLTVEVVESFGFDNVLFMIGVISLGIALFNFLPIPPLDGAGMLVSTVEGVRRGKRLSRERLRMAYTVGTAILIALMVLVTYNDIVRVVTGEGFGL